MGGKGPMVVTVMWIFTTLTWIFVCLRLYTRHFILHQIGIDDHVYFLSGVSPSNGARASILARQFSNESDIQVLLLLYTIFIHIAAVYGFGQSIHTLPLADSALAVKYEMVGQTFAVIGMGVAKMSLGFFLLRIVVVRWHQMVIWLAMVSLMLVSILTAAIFWTQCTPVKKIFDPMRTPEGTCTIPVTPFAVLLGGMDPMRSTIPCSLSLS